MTKVEPTVTEDRNSGDIAGLREQIIANAAQLFPAIIQTHLEYHDTTIAKPREIFAVIVLTESGTSPETDKNFAVLTFGNPMARETAATGPIASSVEDALRGLLRITGLALPEIKREAIVAASVKQLFAFEGGGYIPARLLPDSTSVPTAEIIGPKESASE